MLSTMPMQWRAKVLIFVKVIWPSSNMRLTANLAIIRGFEVRKTQGSTELKVI